MTPTPIMTVALIEEADIVAARQRARQIADLLGFEAQDQTRIATAVSEIARNATTYGGGGRIEFGIENADIPSLIIRIRDKGPGIADVDAILEGRFRSTSGMGVGISGTRRLMDRFEFDSQPGQGTSVVLGKRLPKTVTSVSTARLAEIGKVLAATGASDPLVEARTQNQELLQALAALKAKQDESDRLNAELEETNRGVVALYAELDGKAAQLSALNGQLEGRVAAAVSECQQANDALRQSQKMEAVGQLTGGIAHDFNNLLQIVTGNLEMLLRRLPADDVRLRRAADNAMSGAQRAATLTQRLLAFARRQPLAPKPLDPNQLVEGMSDLMRRTLGETVSVDVRLAPELWKVEADANQLENALLNLAVNARDAMSPGGTLTI
ncbi:ATP-binding protein, partial [Sphingomonas sp. PsM26]|nr:ATP-binding protein [Sphingomonas sp. PsM26]